MIAHPIGDPIRYPIASDRVDPNRPRIAPIVSAHTPSLTSSILVTEAIAETPASSAVPSHRMDGQPCPRCNRLICDGCSLCCCEHPEHAATWQGVECPACGTGAA